MSTPHKASAEQWAQIEKFVSDYGYNSCLLDLRARIEALEADGPAVPSREPASVAMQPTPTSSLAEQGSAPASADVRPTVKARITQDRDETGDYLIIHDASPYTGSLVERVDRAAIREVAAWLRDRGGYPWAWVAQTLEQEADR